MNFAMVIGVRATAIERLEPEMILLILLAVFIDVIGYYMIAKMSALDVVAMSAVLFQPGIVQEIIRGGLGGTNIPI